MKPKGRTILALRLNKLNRCMKSWDRVLNKIPKAIASKELKLKLKRMKKNIIRRAIASDVDYKMKSEWTTSNLNHILKNNTMIKRKLMIRLGIRRYTLKQ